MDALKLLRKLGCRKGEELLYHACQRAPGEPDVCAVHQVRQGGLGGLPELRHQARCQALG
eukprot:5054334-Lingulodinium_polyedra.AAC.1